MTKRPDSNTPQAEANLEVHDAEQKKSTPVAMKKEERLEKTASKSGLEKTERGS